MIRDFLPALMKDAHIPLFKDGPTILLYDFFSAGFSLVISLVDYFYSHPNYVIMASNVIIAFALNLPEVQRIYGIRRDNDGSSH